MDRMYNIRVTNSLSSEELYKGELSLGQISTVAALKEHIEAQSGVPAKEQQLLLGARVMRNGSALEDLLPDTGKDIEISLIRSTREDPQLRQQMFIRQYCDQDYGFGRRNAGGLERWAFHNSHAGVVTDLDRGFSSNKLFIKIQQDSKHAVTFSLCSLDFPLRELFDTFAEQLGLPVAELEFSFQGRYLRREDTPHLCGMESIDCDQLDKAYVIDVKYADGQRRRQRLLGILNRMGEAVQLAPRSLRASGAWVPEADSLTRVLSYLGVSDLISTTLASTLWFHATQRLSLLLQLQHGDLAFTKSSPQEYKAWLINVFGHSQQLALAEAEREAQARHEESKLWNSLYVSKEKATRRSQPKAYNFCKASGCRTMKTVELHNLSPEVQDQWLSLNSSRSKFMAECEAHSIEKGDPGAKSRGGWHRESALDNLTKLLSSDDPKAAELQQELPPLGSQYFTAQAVRPELQAVAVELFRRYFSPDMYFIFPLMVGRESGFGLDFTSTTTTLFFGPNAHAVAPAAPAPAGACSWRFRHPPELELVSQMAADVEKPKSLLEVLFIAVWEDERDQVHGGTLVADLEAQAREAGVKMLYVEIGFEQPKARRFWKKQGFGKVVQKEASESRLQQLVEAEDHEDVPMPLVALPQSQLAFFESSCLRFADTAQYVKVL